MSKWMKRRIEYLAERIVRDLAEMDRLKRLETIQHTLVNISLKNDDLSAKVSEIRKYMRAVQ